MRGSRPDVQPSVAYGLRPHVLTVSDIGLRDRQRVAVKFERARLIRPEVGRYVPAQYMGDPRTARVTHRVGSEI